MQFLQILTEWADLHFPKNAQEEGNPPRELTVNYVFKIKLNPGNTVVKNDEMRTRQHIKLKYSTLMIPET